MEKLHDNEELDTPTEGTPKEDEVEDSDLDAELDEELDELLDDEEAFPEDEEDDAEDKPEGKPEASKEALSAIAQKRKWRERALAAEAKLKEPQEKQAPAKQLPINDNAIIHFRLDHPTLKSSEVAEIQAYAKAKGVSLEEATRSDVIRIMIARNRKKAQHQGGSVEPSRRAVPTKKQPDWSTASRQDIEKEASRRLAAAQATRK